MFISVLSPLEEYKFPKGRGSALSPSDTNALHCGEQILVSVLFSRYFTFLPLENSEGKVNT